jgi:alcohol dehydrogenase
MNFLYNIPTKIHFGPGCISKLANEKLPGRKALIVITSGKSMRQFGYLEKVQELLTQNKVESIVFDKILPNPINEHIMEGAEIAKQYYVDFVIGLGGGSSIDSAKSIAIMARNEGNYWDYMMEGTGKKQKVKNDPLPIVAITTTAGTGTEADPWTVITNEKTNEKMGFGYEKTFPVLSFVDPELMLSVPPKLTAYQGFDAFFHAAEGYIANIATPVSDMYALKSIELITKYLPRAIDNGNDLEARTQVALANTLSGFVESTSSCTSEHSMEHALSAFYPELPHGAGLIMLSQAYFTFFAEKEPGRMMKMAEAMGEDLNNYSPLERHLSFVHALRKLQEKCNVSNLKMSDYGIKKYEIEKLAQNAHDTMGFLFTLDPVKLSFEDTVKIMRDAYR